MKMARSAFDQARVENKELRLYYQGAEGTESRLAGSQVADSLESEILRSPNE